MHGQRQWKGACDGFLRSHHALEKKKKVGTMATELLADERLNKGILSRT